MMSSQNVGGILLFVCFAGQTRAGDIFSGLRKGYTIKNFPKNESLSIDKAFFYPYFYTPI